MLTVQSIDAYYGQAKILHGLSLNINQGEVVALLGRNGAGKSTTMKSIIGIVPPRAGRITFRDQDIGGRPSHIISQMGLGYVPEERRIFTSLTVLENLEVGRQPAVEGLQPWTHERLFEIFPNLAERRNNLGSEMSGGEQQMLTVARTLMGNPWLVLLDEPSEGLAPVIVEQMAHTILDLKKEGLTILISEQNLHFARLVADRAFIVEKGETRYEGTMDELEANSEIKDTYLAV
jgi:branched-chain amino acid transport system ATP-binding protein